MLEISSLLLLNCVCQPLQPVYDALPGDGTGGLDEPIPLLQLPQPKLVRDLRRAAAAGQIELVGEEENRGLPHPVVVKDVVQFLRGLLEPVPVGAVHHVDEGVGVLEVVLPQRPELCLAAHIPDGEVNVLVDDAFNVESDGGDGVDDLPQLQLVQHRGLPRVVQAQHQDAGRGRAEETVHQRWNKNTHITFILWIIKSVAWGVCVLLGKEV